MNVEEARRQYQFASYAVYGGMSAHAGLMVDGEPWPVYECEACMFRLLKAEACSIAYDLAIAVESEERQRRSVAW